MVLIIIFEFEFFNTNQRPSKQVIYRKGAIHESSKHLVPKASESSETTEFKDNEVSD